MWKKLPPMHFAAMTYSLARSCLTSVRTTLAMLVQLVRPMPSAMLHALGVPMIVLPLVFPALLAAMLMVFAVASRELVTSLLLAPAGTQTVAVFIWRQFEQGSAGQGMAMATLTLLTGLTLMLSALALMQRSAR